MCQAGGVRIGPAAGGKEIRTLGPGTRKRLTEGAILCCVFANADRMSFGESAAAEVPQLSSAGIRHDGPPQPPCGKPDDRQRENSSSRVPSSSESVNFGDLGEETRLAGRGVLVVARCLVRGEGRRFGPAPACSITASVGGPLPRAFFSSTTSCSDLPTFPSSRPLTHLRPAHLLDRNDPSCS